MSDVMPSRPQNIALRPLSKGLIANVAPQALPIGSGREVFNLYAMAEGLQRRDGFEPLLPGKASLGQLTLAANEQVQDIIPFFRDDGTYQLLLLTNKRLYSNTGTDNAWTAVKWGRAYSCTSTAANVYNCSAADFGIGTTSPFTGDRVRLGDVVQVQTSAGVWAEAVVDQAITTVTQLHVSAYKTPYATPSDLRVIREFTVTDGLMSDYTYTNGLLIFCDGSGRGIWKYDGLYMTDLKAHGITGDVDINYLSSANTCLYFNGLLMLGHTQETGLDGKRAVRWSSATDISEFAQSDYVLFNRESTPVLKLSAVEDIPIIYLEGAIYAGFPSDLTGLPYQFDKMESGGISAVGMRSMCSSVGGQVFIGSNNIYLLQPSRTGVRQQPQVQAIGDAIASRSCRLMKNPSRSRAFFDVQKDALCFSFDFNSTNKIMTRLFYFFTSSKAWCECDTADLMVAMNQIPYSDTLSWEDADPYDWDNSTFASLQWYGLRAASSNLQMIFASTDGILYRQSEQSLGDQIEAIPADVRAIHGKYESGEMDFDMPNDDKMFNHLSVRVSDVPGISRAGDLAFVVESSSARGVWQNRGQILVEAGSYEEDCSFRERGSLVAFRVSFDEPMEVFRIDEFVIRVRIAGLQVTRGA